MPRDNFSFGCGQLSWFPQNLIRDGHFTDIVEDRADTSFLDLGAIHFHVPAEGHHQGRHAHGMLVEYFPKIMDVKFTARMEEELDEVEEGRLSRLKVLGEFYAPFKEDLDFAQLNIKKEVVTTEEVCAKCGKPMVIKWGRKGKFLSCSAFPACRNSKSIGSGVKCPESGCGGELIERRSKRGFFYGCSNFPNCKFTSRNLPTDKA